MASSFVQSLKRLVIPSRRVLHAGSRTRPDEEQATNVDSSFLGSSTLAPSHIHTGAPGHRVSGDDSLALFRLMLGITIAPHLGFDSSTARPADNVGLYARVVHSEQTAKDNYKVFSAALNACYFLQIIVAAALTAMGAANADNKGITALGSINVVLAGFLSYLKGSGYPARFKQNASEWKKVREYIEHRERDFSYEHCTLDVYEVVDKIRDMYEQTKLEIQLNTPEAASPNMSQGGQGVDKAKADAIASKLHGLEDTFKKMRGHAGAAEAKSDDVLAKVRSLGEAAHAKVSGGVDVKSHADEVASKLRPGIDDAANKVGAVSETVEAKSTDFLSRLRSLEDTIDRVKGSVDKTVHAGQEAAQGAAQGVRDGIERTVHTGQEAAQGAAQHARDTVEKTVQSGQEAAHGAAQGAAQNVALAVQEREKEAAAGLRAVGKAVSMEVEERRPRAPREVSISLGGGNVEAEASFRK
ncbi:hypothetical protein N658DRAFT_496586 [Parathielavia hyrcaniae]|uniref:SMODS and SLOG-associating 2TM effector domain-containing protein n=1 Tax=Parathielavia hyrcaniae TaxID=113614 RepID=A0AAN6Q0N5_9PEZI|nr:hypothetical protein N658DRAFT_496586 [Parathielavia hyrcaniae]